MKINYNKQLNDEQLEVVKNGDGYALVLSGPGSGKTRTLTFRVAYLLEKGVDPESILLLTFTKKAANEMLSRIEGLIGSKTNRVLGGTFHHVGNYYLRKYGDRLGYDENYTILDQEDSKDLIKVVTQEVDEEGDLPGAKTVQKLISLATNSNSSILEVADELRNDSAKEKLVEAEKRYQKRKKKKNLMDYDDLLTSWLKLLRNKKLKNKISSRFQYVLVDEYQDTNIIQDRLLEKLSSVHKNLMVVGDDSQSIYSFRAAEIKNILNFSDRYPAEVFKLETNYRSTPQILNLANCIIKNNQSRLNKDLKSIKEEGEDPMVACLSTPREQSRFIVKKLSSGINPSLSAVLFRAHYHAAGLELELAKENIPYIVRGGTRFFEQAHIKDLSAFLKIIVNFRDEPSWSRILKKESGIGDTYAQRVTESITTCVNLESVFRSKSSMINGLPAKVVPRVKKIIEYLEKVVKLNNPAKIVNYLLKNWYESHIQEFDNPEERMDDLKQLTQLSAEYDNLQEMLSDFTLSEEFELDKDSNRALTLSTIHQAKGLEWENIFIISLKEGKFPHKKSLEEQNLEEERRLFYVAVTRCKRRLFLTYPLFEKRGSTTPSRFLKEIEDELSEENKSNDKLTIEEDTEEEIELIDEDDFDFF